MWAAKHNIVTESDTPARYVPTAVCNPCFLAGFACAQALVRWSWQFFSSNKFRKALARTHPVKSTKRTSLVNGDVVVQLKGTETQVDGAATPLSTELWWHVSFINLTTGYGVWIELEQRRDPLVVGCIPLNKYINRIRLKRRVLEEILHSEESYIAQLDMLLNVSFIEMYRGSVLYYIMCGYAY